MCWCKDNVNRLAESSIATVQHLDRRSKLLFSTIYVEFDDPKADNSWKIEAFMMIWRNVYQIAKKFPLKKGKSTVIVERK